MKKSFLWVVAIGLILSACSPAATQPVAAQPSPVSVSDLQSTAAVLSQQTLQALPTSTLTASATPIVMTETATPPQGTPTETQNPILLTLTATLGTGTPFASNSLQTNTPAPFVIATNTLPFSSTTAPFATFTFATATPNVISEAPTAAQPLQWNVTPYEPMGKVKIVNKSNSKTKIPYISLHCTRKDGSTAYLEYSVENRVTTKAPVGWYDYVVFVDGKKFSGSFKIAEGGSATIVITSNGVTAQ